MKCVTDMFNDSKIASCFKKEPVKKKSNTAIKVFAIIGVIAAVAGAAYVLYRYFKPDYLEDYEDEEFEDDDLDADEEE